MEEDYYNHVVSALANADHGKHERAQVYAMLAVAEATRKQAVATEALTESIGLLLDRLGQFTAAPDRIKSGG